jgi:6,7-dimethyl-8-ribityllumazine synthase
MTTYEGQWQAPGLKIAIVVSRFNELITSQLRQGAVDTLRRLGGDADSVDIVHVPGAFEMPLAAKTLADSGRYAAVVCLGCVIRGATDHYDYVCSQAASGILRPGLDSGVPVVFGVLTTDTLEQALERAGSKGGNKGADAMQTAVEMANLLKQLKS